MARAGCALFLLHLRLTVVRIYGVDFAVQAVGHHVRWCTHLSTLLKIGTTTLPLRCTVPDLNATLMRRFSQDSPTVSEVFSWFLWEFLNYSQSGPSLKNIKRFFLLGGGAGSAIQHPTHTYIHTYIYAKVNLLWLISTYEISSILSSELF